MRAPNNDPGTEEIFGQGLPGTGGDLFRREGEGPAPILRREDDVEGHLYTGGPTTQGEFTKRGPGENPHGERWSEPDGEHGSEPDGLLRY
jgi:hypothetical protein